MPCSSAHFPISLPHIFTFWIWGKGELSEEKSLVTPHFHYFLGIPHLQINFSYTASSSVNSFLPSSSLFQLKCYFTWIRFVDCCVCLRNRGEKVVCQKGEKHCVYMLRFSLSIFVWSVWLSRRQTGSCPVSFHSWQLASLSSVQAGMGLQKHCLHLFNFQAHAGLFPSFISMLGTS